MEKFFGSSKMNTHRLRLGEMQFFAILLGFLTIASRNFHSVNEVGLIVIFSPTKTYKHCGGVYKFALQLKGKFSHKVTLYILQTENLAIYTTT